MSCSCGAPSCGGSPCTTAPRDTAFTVQTSRTFSGSLSRLLQKPVDRLRDLYTRFGQRPYIVRLIVTRWVAGARGAGEESVVSETLLLPTPLILDLSTLTPVVTSMGSDEQGNVLLTEVSGCYTEEQLRGLDATTGDMVPADESFYYEIEFLRADGQPSERRRFSLYSAPYFKADMFQWEVRLERARPDRTRQGAPR